MDKVVFFYGGIEPLIRIVVVGTLAYASLLILLRISGKRALAQLNAFDFVITAMQAQRVTQAQLLAAVRENRIASLEEVEAIVMESAGTIAVVKKETAEEVTDASALSNIPKVNH